MMMSAHERTISCGHINHEYTAEDLPAEARYLVAEVYRAYANGVEIEEYGRMSPRSSTFSSL